MGPGPRRGATRQRVDRPAGSRLAARLAVGLGCLGLGLAGCSAVDEEGGEGRIMLDPAGFWGPSAEETGDRAGLLMGRAAPGDYYFALDARHVPAADVKLPDGHPMSPLAGIDLAAACRGGRLILAADQRSGVIVATVEPPPDGGPWADHVGGFVPILGYAFADGGCLLAGDRMTFTPLLRDAGGAIEVTVAQRTQTARPIAAARLAEARRAAAHRMPDAGSVGTQPTLNRIAGEIERGLGGLLDTTAQSLVQTRFAFSSAGPNSPEYLIPLRHLAAEGDRFAGAIELAVRPRASRFAVPVKAETLLPDYAGRGLDVLPDLRDARGRELRAVVQQHGRAVRGAALRAPPGLESLCGRMVTDLEPFGLSNYDLGFVVHRVLEQARVNARSVFPADPAYAQIGCARRFTPAWRRSGLGSDSLAEAPARSAPIAPRPPPTADARGSATTTRAAAADGPERALKDLAEALATPGAGSRERALGRVLGSGSLVIRNPINLAPLAVAGLPAAGPVPAATAAQGLAAIQSDGAACVSLAGRAGDGYDGAVWLKDGALGWLRLRGAIGRDASGRQGRFAALVIDRPVSTDGAAVGVVDSAACRRAMEMLPRPRG
jgi:hypothetical protein